MDIRLYQYYDLPNVANKLTGLTPLFSSLDIPGFTVYGTFDPVSAVFVLSEYYPANYASYVYGNVTYYGTCYVTTTTRGEYEYKVTVDPVTTTWYHSAVNTTQWVDYGPGDGGAEIDSRLPRSEDLTVIRREYGPVLKDGDFDVWLILANPNGQNFASQKYKLTPGAYRVYVFQRDAGINGVQHYRRFLRNLFRLSKNIGIFAHLDNYLASMIKAYVVPHALCANNAGLTMGEVELHSLSGELLNSDNTIRVPNGPDSTGWLDDFEEYTAFEVPLQESNALSPLYVEFSLYGLSDGVKREGTWSIVFPFIGEVQFTPDQCFPASAVSVGAEISFNPIGGFYTVQMEYGAPPDEPRPFRSGLYTFPVQETTTVLAPGAPSFQSLSAISNMFGIATGLKHTTTTIKRTNSTTRKNKTTTLTAINTSQGTEDTRGSSLEGLFGDYVSLFSSHSGACHGTTDGSPYRSDVAMDKRVTLYVTYYDYIAAEEAAEFWKTYGAPVSSRMTLTPKLFGGYIQTHDAIFPCGFLPPAIVRQAEIAFDQGVYLRKED